MREHRSGKADALSHSPAGMSFAPRGTSHAGAPPHLILPSDRHAVVDHEGSHVPHEAVSAGAFP